MAQHLLLNGFSARDAAAEVGFADYSAFYRAYVRILGHAPSEDKGGTLPLGNRSKEKMESVVLKNTDNKI
ncbi:MAG: AraC family transcriptional regulator [Lachnospiraceae bacterium]|nr:AraC family transcriptional regulator [Lachnospiraceae bacterium]